MSDNLLQVRDLKVYYPIMSGIIRKIAGYVKALDGVDFSLKQGAVLGIVGETGCGKTTLGRAILRLVEPTAGQVIFEGKDVLKLNRNQLKEFRHQAQIVFQDPLASLNPRKTVFESIGEGLRFHGMVKNSREQKERVAEVLEWVGFSPESMLRYPHQFSGGQQQRLCIARAIVLNPKFIVCDEAVSALDVSIQAQILNLLQDLKQRLSLSYLFISHDLSTIKYLSDHVVVLYLGHVMEKASVRALFSHPRHPYTQILLSAIPKAHPSENKERLMLTGAMPSAANPPSGCPFRTRCPYAQPICSKTPPKKVVKDPSTGEENEYHCIL